MNAMLFHLKVHPRSGELVFVSNPDGGPLPGGEHARLVLVLGTFHPGMAVALLVTEEHTIAGPADTVLTPRELGMDMELCVHADLAISLVDEQLGETFGSIDESVLEVIKEASATGEYPEGPVADTLHRGHPIPPLGDARWDIKLAELRVANQLGAVIARLIDEP